MALGFSNLTSGQSTSSSTKSASVDVGDDEAIYVTVIAAFNDGSNRLAASTATIDPDQGTIGATWVLVAEQAWGFRRKTWVYRYVNTSGSTVSGTVGWSFTAPETRTYREHFWSVDLVTGIDTTTPNDAATKATPAASTSMIIADVGTPGASDGLIAVFYTDDTTQSSTSAAITDLGDQSGGADVRSLITGYDADAGDETPQATCASHENGGIGFIVNAAAGAGGLSIPVAYHHYSKNIGQ